MTGSRLVDSPDLKLIPFDEVLDFDRDGIAFQHEIDHHKGILISDVGTEVFIW